MFQVEMFPVISSIVFPLTEIKSTGLKSLLFNLTINSEAKLTGLSDFITLA